MKSQVCDNVALYAQKYDEEFGPFLPNFVTAIWGLLVSTGQEVKYDLVSSLMWVLKEVFIECNCIKCFHKVILSFSQSDIDKILKSFFSAD